MYSRRRWVAFLVASLLGGALLAPRLYSRDADEADSSGLLTLNELDPLTHSFFFGSKRFGAALDGHRIRVQPQADIDFGAYQKDALTVGLDGREGVIVDMGAPDALKEKYGYPEVVGNGDGFASLRLADKGEAVLVLKDYFVGKQTTQDVKEAAPLFERAAAQAHAPINVGHIYLVRITDPTDASFQRTVKFLVLAYTPGQTVTLRWAVL
jgi:hypothetical protein